jgi:surfactin synthase thioesterase subunit
VYFAGGCIIGTGVLLYIYTTPTDEELIASFSPEIRADYEKNRELRQREQMEVMKIAQKTSKSNDPIWKTGSIGSPFEKEQRNLSQQMVDQQLFFNERAKQEQMAEIQKAQLEIEEAKKLVSKKPWWKVW